MNETAREIERDMRRLNALLAQWRLDFDTQVIQPLVEKALREAATPRDRDGGG